MPLSSNAEIVYPLFRKIRLSHVLDNERKKNPVWYHKWNFAGLFLIPFYFNIIDKAMIEMFPCDNHFLFPLFLHGYDFPWEKL